MPLLEETVVLAGGAARIALALWRESAGALRYRLCFTRAGACLVRYDNEQGRARPLGCRGARCPMSSARSSSCVTTSSARSRPRRLTMART